MLFRISLQLTFLVALPTLCFSKYHVQNAIGDPSFQVIFEDSQSTFNLVREALKKSSIIPDVLDDFTPSCLLAPYYAKKHRGVILGNELNPKKLQQPPALKIRCPHWNGEKVNGLTVVMTDPDAPSRDNPEWSQFCHWIAKIPLEERDGAMEGVVDVSVLRGGVEDVVEYKPPGPPPKTGLHRYVFVVLTGENGNLTAPEERRNWGTGKERYGVRDWAEYEGLKVVGANFFVAKNKKQK